MRYLPTFAITTFVLCTVFTGCDQKNDHQVVDKSVELPNGKKVKVAVAKISPSKGNPIEGTVTFELIEEGSKGVRVVADIQGLTPGKHGFHVHENGVCEGDFSSAGGHFNPLKKQHGSPTSHDRHSGDMGNLEADQSGKAHLEYTDTVIELDGPNSIIGKAVIVHEKQDDLKTQPSGDAGGRIGCGIIGISVVK